MTTPTAADSLARYLDILGGCLEDPGATGEDLAARAYLSRYHFDRLAGAALGETPGAFRRRLLLERAAYALIVTDATILDIAIGAGYGSHEAFSRAFARAFGVPPTLWRADPDRRRDRGTIRDFELAAPSGIHFQPPSGLRLPEPRRVTTMNTLLTFVDHHIDLVGRLADRLPQVPEQELDRELTLEVDWCDGGPVTVRSLASNLVTQEERYLFAVQGRELPETPDDSLDGIMARHAAAGPAFRDFVVTVVANDNLGDTFVMTAMDPPQTPYRRQRAIRLGQPRTRSTGAGRLPVGASTSRTVRTANSAASSHATMRIANRPKPTPISPPAVSAEAGTPASRPA